MVMRAAIIVLVILFAAVPSQGQIINEVLANEPQNATLLEWVELYNDGDITESLALCRFYIEEPADTFYLNLESGGVPAKGYAVICRNLAAFESYWGNNSGTWGDDPSEDYRLYERPGLILSNSWGSVTLICGGHTTISWSEPGLDGYSWERIHPDSESVYQCIDPYGATPGRANSRIPKAFDLELVSATGVPGLDGETVFDFRIANVGLDEVSGDSLFLFYDPEQDTVVTRTDLIAVFDLPTIASGESTTVSTGLTIDGYYTDLLAQLMSDSANGNNIILFTAPGSGYPPVVLSEFLPDPESPLGSEWVELRNRSNEAIEIGTALLGDSVSLHPVAADTLSILPYEYLVLCKDSIDFINYYGSHDFRLRELAAWPAFNNGRDLVRLVDEFGFMADSIRYDSGYGGNITWARGEVPGYTDRWGRSADTGGTPGAENNVLFPAQAPSIEVTMNHNPFSPSRDGVVSIEFDVPPGSMTIKIYDVRGREARTFYDNFASYQGAIDWDGTDNEGRLLPVGIYILFVEVSGYGSHKETIVLAP